MHDHRHPAGVALVLALMLGFAGALPGAAAANQAKGDFAVFRQCQTKDPAISRCIVARESGGELTLGRDTVPVNHTITLQGGTHVDGGTGQEKFIAAENGESLSHTALAVPGGLVGILDGKALSGTALKTYEEVLENGLTGVTATIELVGEPGVNLENLVLETGVALSLPVRVKLSNVFLGSGCYVGSQAHPIVLQLTSGTTSPPSPNSPISGTAGTITFADQDQIVRLEEDLILDNAFAEPGAEGCGGIFAAQVDPAIDAELELPSAAGHNTAELEGTVEVAEAPAVIASE